MRGSLNVPNTIVGIETLDFKATARSSITAIINESLKFELVQVGSTQADE